MGDRKKQTHKDGRRGSVRDPLFSFSGITTAVGTPSVRSAYDGYAASETEGFFKGSFPQDGLLIFFHFYLVRGPEAFAYLVCLGAHKESTRPP